jgi:glycosyltransferase involved in cell wall biosynthesis
MPHADVVYCTSWWFLAELHQRGLARPGCKYLADVVDDYSWHNREPFAFALALADGLLTQSIRFLVVRPDAVFHPFPSDPVHPKRERVVTPHEGLRVGMISNGWSHNALDHKGVGVMREAITTARDMGVAVTLEVAGLDILLRPEDMPAWYDSLDVFASLSLHEGFSAAVVDAAALGCPILSCGASPARPFMGHGGEDGAYIAETRQADDLACRLRALAEEPREALDKRAEVARELARGWSAVHVGGLIGTIMRGLE